MYLGGLMDVGIVMKVKWMRYEDYMCNCVVVEDVRCIYERRFSVGKYGRD